LVDTTRLAAGDPALWTDILSANADQVRAPVRALGQRLLDLSASLDVLAAGAADVEQARQRVRALLEAGNAGRERVPLKRGEVSGAFLGVRVSVADEPGQLAALLAAAGSAQLNVEDVRVEHVPGRPRGVIELLVAPEAAEPLRAALETDGWHVL
jgi:prephenate dehydrogenase